jgi:hypothetical protein
MNTHAFVVPTVLGARRGRRQVSPEQGVEGLLPLICSYYMLV